MDENRQQKSNFTLTDNIECRKPNVTKKRKNPYINFTQDFLANFSGDNVSQQAKICEAGERWRQMTVEEKQPFIELAEKARRKRRRFM